MLTRITKTGNRHRDRTVSNHPHVVSRPGTQPVSREESEGLRERQSLLWRQENGRKEPAQVAPGYLVSLQPGEQEVSEQMAPVGLFRWKDWEKEQDCPKAGG